MGNETSNDELQLAILKAIILAEGHERLVPVSAVADQVRNLDLSPRQLAAVIDALRCAGRVTGVGDYRAGLRFVRLTDAGRAAAGGAVE